MVGFRAKFWRILCNSLPIIYPNSLDQVFITGGLPPLKAHPDDIYRATYKRVIEKNKLLCKFSPHAKKNARRIADHLIENKIHLQMEIN